MSQDTADPMTDNGALNAIVDELQLISGSIAGQYDAVSGDTTWRNVTDTKTLARAVEPTAIKTTITNKGPNPVRVFEGGILVLIVPPGKTEPLPLNGAGELKWECQTSLSSEAALATYKKTA